MKSSPKGGTFPPSLRSPISMHVESAAIQWSENNHAGCLHRKRNCQEMTLSGRSLKNECDTSIFAGFLLILENQTAKNYQTITFQSNKNCFFWWFFLDRICHEFLIIFGWEIFVPDWLRTPEFFTKNVTSKTCWTRKNREDFYTGVKVDGTVTMYWFIKTYLCQPTFRGRLAMYFDHICSAWTRPLETKCFAPLGPVTIYVFFHVPWKSKTKQSGWFLSRDSGSLILPRGKVGYLAWISWVCMYIYIYIYIYTVHTQI